MSAIDKSDRIENAVMKRVKAAYNAALRTALEKQKELLQTIADIDSGKIKPPAKYNEKRIAKWRQTYVRKLMRQNNTVDAIMQELNAAGVQAATLIHDGLADVWQENNTEAAETITEAAAEFGQHPTFSQFDKRQILAILDEDEPPFSRLAYDHLGNNKSIRKKLQNELLQATINGESQGDIIERIRNITGQSINQARRVAQTERTRIQSHARHMAMQEAADDGVNVVAEWSTRMVRSRESHVQLDGVRIPQGELFTTINGAKLAYPGDTSHGAPAHETINCFCVLIPDVIMPNERTNAENQQDTI